ncbi:MAG: hypothetical protein AB7E52_05520, partial [Bdellovibrionales bacterium]
MKKIALRTAAYTLAAALLLGASPTQAASNGLAIQYDWQAAWGSILPDTGIPSANFNVKNDINRAVQQCGTSTDYASIPAYIVDLNGDGAFDYIDSAYPYFYRGVTASCPLRLCTSADGCNISIYLHENYTQILSESETETASACPEQPEKNTTCRSDCP